MKILTLDVGNTTVDACTFERGKLEHLGRFPHTEIGGLSGRYDLVVVSSVRSSLNEKLKATFRDRLRILKLEDIPIEINYETPKTLGIDRILLAYGVKELYAESAVLVSAGTALVVDLLLRGVFMGGFITAGLGLKLRTLSEKAEGLPNLEPEPLETPVGKSTRECLLGGTYLESLIFIKETVRRWREEFGEELPIFITGGEGRLFESFGVYDPLLLHRAMLRIIINE